MSEQQIPAGWYPDPVDTDSDPRPQRWWDGKGWTAETRPAPTAPTAPTDTAPTGTIPTGTAPADAPPAAGAAAPGPAAPGAEDTAVLEGTVLDASGQTVHYPPLPPYAGHYGAKPTRSKPSKPVLVAASVAALLGLLAGSGITYLVMDGNRSETKSAAGPSNDGRRSGGGFGSGGLGEGGSGGSGGNTNPGDPFGFGNGGIGGGNGNGSGGTGGGSGKSSAIAVDTVNGISLPVPSGWEGGTTNDGYAGLTVGDYTCADGKDNCSLGGVFTTQIAGTDAKQAAQNDIADAAKAAYGKLNSHKELKNEAVTVAGRSGYLVRWQVDAEQGNPGYVQTVVFPTADGKALTAVHFGFDIADKAPGLNQMDTILKGIAKADASSTGGGHGTTT
ncbi:DUF2510 domain-containing protein [Kitasatospora phosalacinea]|uniref:DUF2510 domain-containing protein n=1 Tax=Kitasatospora phosalacinea TaxID=2065 RepID=A0A9W6PKZ0_9ACTN|nr:DUF2510 domain-containing protein [Kitasatospora phosalacinea]GLW56761.1 hypothetical protein Kpho01_47720 [Kitasatospora phosalacinea]